MRTHRPSSGWIVASAVLLACTALAAQQAARAKPVSPAAVQKAEQEIDKAAAARGIKLTDAAKRVLARQAVHQEATTAPDIGPVTGALSDDKLSKLLTPLADAPQDKKLDAREVEMRVTDHKTKQVLATLPADITAHVRTSGKTLPDDVRVKMLDDLTKQSAALSTSGLAVEEIRFRNEATLHAIDQAVGSGPITTQSYQVAMAGISRAMCSCRSSARLTAPTSARLDSRSARPTSLTSNSSPVLTPLPFGCLDMKWRSAIYMSCRRRRQLVHAGPHTGVEPRSAARARAVTRPGPDSRRALPWGYAILGGIIVVFLAALVARRR